MILVDTSVWVDFFRGTARSAELSVLLETNLVLLHPWVLGELVLGGLGSRRDAVIADLSRLPVPPSARDEEVLELIKTRRLSGRGIGWVDAHLVASVLIAGCELWTFDGRLAAVTRELGAPVVGDPAPL